MNLYLVISLQDENMALMFYLDPINIFGLCISKPILKVHQSRMAMVSNLLNQMTSFITLHQVLRTETVNFLPRRLPNLLTVLTSLLLSIANPCNWIFIHKNHKIISSRQENVI